MKANWDQYVGLVLLFIYILLKYLGSVQRVESPFFEDYIASITADIEGSGAVFGYIMKAPIVETVFSLLLSAFFIGLFFVTKVIVLKWTSEIGNLILMVFIFVICLWGVSAALRNILMYVQWDFSILILADCSFLLFLIYYVGYILSIQKRRVRVE
ncbi:hypothetical protein ACFOZY_07980 [Chungangia koreensis]|uniref:Exosortase/archaeosortase family protein n=1 Tax=Chungangia koreensis TaxID=752657 RepID=A0ABV8X5H4_9LACT